MVLVVVLLGHLPQHQTVVGELPRDLHYSGDYLVSLALEGYQEIFGYFTSVDKDNHNSSAAA